MASGQARPATQASDSERLRAAKAAEMLRVAREISAMKDLGTMNVADVARVRVVDGRILATTSVDVGDQEGRLSLRGLPGIVELGAMGARVPGPLVGSAGFSFFYQDTSRPDDVLISMQVLSAALITQFNYTDDGLDGALTVSLIEQTVPGRAPILLRVDETSSEWNVTPAPAPRVSTNLTAETFEQLRQEHRHEVDDYVRPMFRLLGQERAVFAVDRGLAWEALIDEYVVDPAMVKKIEAILPRLGAEDFSSRDAASDELAAMGVDGVITLQKMPMGKLSPEQQNRIDAFLRPYKINDVKALLVDRNFMVDCLYCDDARLRKTVMEHLSALTGKTVAWKDVDGDAARDAEIAALRDDVLGATTRPR
jgi:hypothetical protein